MSDLCSEINNFGKAVSNKTRYRIIESLLKGRKTVSELVKIVKLSQPAVSQHLKTLKSYKIVMDERSGQEVFYTVNTEHALNLLQSMIKDMNKCKTKNKK